jgi:hypothetical protein
MSFATATTLLSQAQIDGPAIPGALTTSSLSPNIPAPTTSQLSRLRKLRPETREAVLKRLRELQAKVPPSRLDDQTLWSLYLEAADQIIEEIPGRIHPLLPPEKMLLFLVDLHTQLQK